MEVLEDRILKRSYILDNLEYYIAESVYYRSFSDEINFNDKKTLYKLGDLDGKVHIK